MIKIRQATDKGFIELKNGGVADLTYPSSKTRRGRVQNNGMICPTILTEGEIMKINRDEYEYRIRKLTPRESGRLMGVSDPDIDQILSVNSNSQAYKQFGNSIVVDVMCAMFRNLNIKGVNNG